MNAAAHEPQVIDLLVTADQRRVSISEVQQFRDSIRPEPQEGFDEIDLLVQELRNLKPENQ